MESSSLFDMALSALCVFIQLGITGIGLLLMLTFFAVGRGVEPAARKPWTIALGVTTAVVALGWLGVGLIFLVT